MNEIERYLNLRRLVDVLYDIQDVRMRTANRLRQMPKSTSKIYVQPFLDMEKNVTQGIDVMLGDIPIYTEFLQHIRGVGPRISGCIVGETMIKFERVLKEEYEEAKSQVNNETQDEGVSQKKSETQNPSAMFSKEQLRLALKTEKGGYLIPVLRGIGTFSTVSRYWAWWGLHVVDGHAAKRKRGQEINWNPKMRTLSWKIGKQFVRQGLGYRSIYDREKDRLTELRMPLGKCPQYEECKAKLKKRKEPACKGHIHNMAKRKTVKLFLSHLWERWRRLEGLPVRGPYAIEKMGHTTKEDTPVE